MRLPFGEIRELKDKLAQEKTVSRKMKIRSEMNFAPDRGETALPCAKSSSGWKPWRRRIRRLLIYGETGTGKETDCAGPFMI